jgi:TolA-binding protein
MARDSRVTLARATAAMLAGRPNDAAMLLGPKPAGAAATYLYGAAQGAAGSLLRSAAAFQEVADRWPDSPLRDAALLAKANAFLAARDVKSAAQEFARAAARITDPSLRAEAELRAAGCVQLGGATDSSLALLRDLVSRTAGTDVAARAQFLIGEALAAQRRPADAIVEYNRVLTDYFKHDVASSAQYRVARCLDALGRRADATGSYEAVVRGYPLSPEAPAAAYLAGVGMLAQQRPLAAAPYFQLVVDRYASARDAKGLVVFASPEHQELVEAALCLLELSYHRTGNLGQLSGAPHLVLRAMPPSHSLWHAYALLVDADASASQARYPRRRRRSRRSCTTSPIRRSARPRISCWRGRTRSRAATASRSRRKSACSRATARAIPRSRARRCSTSRTSASTRSGSATPRRHTRSSCTAGLRTRSGCSRAIRRDCATCGSIARAMPSTAGRRSCATARRRRSPSARGRARATSTSRPTATPTPSAAIRACSSTSPAAPRRGSHCCGSGSASTTPGTTPRRSSDSRG